MTWLCIGAKSPVAVGSKKCKEPGAAVSVVCWKKEKQTKANKARVDIAGLTKGEGG